MDQNQSLSFGEFVRDLRLIIAAPGHRFSVIRERGASWGSMVLLILPTYFAFAFTGGLVFSRDPFPGYSFIPPLIIAVLAVLLKLYALHVSARLLQGKKRDGMKPGSFADLKVVFGYTSVPAILAILLATVVFLSIPQKISYLMHDLRVVGVSIMVALAISLFIWNLILVVLALRTVYAMRDIKLVGAFILGSALMWIPGILSYWIVARPPVPFEYVEPVLSPSISRLYASDSSTTTGPSKQIHVDMDRLAYFLRDPERFELVVVFMPQGKPTESHGMIILGSRPGFRWDEGDCAVGRILGMPGDTVELVKGSLRINDRSWDEPYLAPEYRTEESLPAKVLGSQEYFILPDNRHLIGNFREQFVMSRDRILGREILNRWPLGWWIYRPTVFLRPVAAQ
jgi:signal peptidase I